MTVPLVQTDQVSHTAIPVSSLRQDLMDRVRRMTRVDNEHHPWVNMTDEEMLRSCGLILENPETNIEGITLAAVLLFGANNRIMSVLPQHKTDAIFRVFNVDRYDVLHIWGVSFFYSRRSWNRYICVGYRFPIQSLWASDDRSDCDSVY